MKEYDFKKKPNLFIVGAAKAGTTSLHYLLSKHPEVYMTALKEPGFFCTDLHKESDDFHNRKRFFSIRTFDQYKELFQNANEEKVRGESSADYLYSKDAAKNIYDFNPDSKIIIMLREPISQIKSLYLELYAGLQGDTVRSLEKALELENVRKKGLNVPRTARMPSSIFYRENAHYYKHLKSYLSIFPRENIHFIIFEKLITDSYNEIDKIFRFLKVKHMTIPLKQKNTRYEKFYLKNKKVSAPIIKFIGRHFKIRRSTILSNFRSLIQISDVDEMVEISDHLFESLKSEFKYEVNKLSEITGFDLEYLWGYQ